MKHSVKIRTLCVALATLLVLLSFPAASVSAASIPAAYPVIRMTGGQAPLADIENGTQYPSVYDLNPESLADIFNEIKEPLLDAVKKLDWETAGTVFGSIVWDLFEELRMYPDGTSKNLLYRSGDHTATGGLFSPLDKDENGVYKYVTPKRVVPEPPVILKITGPASMTVTQDAGGNYAAASSGAFTVTGNPPITVALTGNDGGGKITWNGTTMKLDIAAGLAAGTYAVTLTATNGVDAPSAVNFTLTVREAPPPPALGITGPASMTITQDTEGNYAATSSGAFTLTGTGPVAVALTGNDGGGKITWNDATKKIDVAAGLAVGTYAVTLTAENGLEPAKAINFTLTVQAAPVEPPPPSPGFMDVLSKLFDRISEALKPIGERLGRFAGDVGGVLGDTFFGIYDGTQDYLDANGMKGKQPEPDFEAWGLPGTHDTLSYTYSNVPSGNNNTFLFGFDWRQSPIKAADMLHDYVMAVTEYTGAEKVYIQSVSASGSIVLAYADKYINADEPDPVAGIFSSVTMANGMGAYGTLFQKKLSIDARALGYADSIQPIMDEVDPKIHAILNTLYLSGLSPLVSALTEFIPPAFMDAFFDTALVPVYGLFPGMWGTVPPDMYDAAKKASFGDKVNDPEYAGFFAQTDAYNDLQLRAGEVLREAASKIKFAVVSGYGNTPWAIAKNQGLQGDTVTETVYSSYGATVSKIGQTLGKNYPAKIHEGCAESHLSPDLEIDAATCALPDSTWFVKGMWHGNQYDVNGLFAWWYSTDDPTVFSSERWPQYLYAYGNVRIHRQDAVYPLSEPIFEGSQKISDFKNLWNSFLNLWTRLWFLLTGSTAAIWNGAAGLFK